MPESPSRFPATAALLFLCCSLLLAGLNAPFGAPDEFAHFWHAYFVSEGNAVVPRNDRGERITVLPKRLWDSLVVLTGFPNPPMPKPKLNREGWQRVWRMGFHADERQAYQMPGTSLYSPMAYLPAAAAIAVGRKTHCSLLLTFYCARAVNAVVAAALLYFTLRLLPIGRTSLAVIALLPMNTFLAGSLSADAMALALGFLWTALCFDLVRAGRAPLECGHWTLLLGVAFLVGQTKLAGILFALGLAPLLRSGAHPRVRLAGAAAAALVLLSAAGWLWLNSPLQPATYPGGGADPAAQRALVFADPFRFLAVLGHTFQTHGLELFQQFVGILGWLQVRLPAWVYWVASGALLASTALVARPSQPPAAVRIALLILAFCIYAGIHFALYQSWNAVGAPVIVGVQGRYFLPVAPLVAIALANPLLAQSSLAPRLSWALLGIAALLNAGAAWALAQATFA